MGLFSLRGIRAAMPLGAFLSFATLATVLAAQAQIACTSAVAIGMDMGSMPMVNGPIALCPVVLVLSAAAGLLTLNALAVHLVDPKRESLQPLASFIVRQPIARSLICLLTLGGGAVGTMMAVDHATPQGTLGWLALGGIIVASALAATIVALVLSRCLIAVVRRFTLVLEHEIRVGRRAAGPLFVNARHTSRLVPIRIPLLAAGRGLRAPPPHVFH